MKFFWIFLFLEVQVQLLSLTIDPAPFYIQRTSTWEPTLVNSVDFHPEKNYFCVTYTQHNKVIIYSLDEEGRIKILQTLQNPMARLSCPQHALFSKSKEMLVVANWVNQTFNVYPVIWNDQFQPKPSLVYAYSKDFDRKDYKPHGIAFSPDGNYFAAAFGASSEEPRGIALYKFEKGFHFKSFNECPIILEGIPKGIAFTPDGTALAVTLSEINAIVIFPIDWKLEKINEEPSQIFYGPSTEINRPEDIKFTKNGEICAISNSSIDTVTFYHFNKITNEFLQNNPCVYLQNPKAELFFPHGLAFSADERYFVVTQFGPVIFDDNNNLISWGCERKEGFAIFKTSSH